MKSIYEITMEKLERLSDDMNSIQADDENGHYEFNEIMYKISRIKDFCEILQEDNMSLDCAEIESRCLELKNNYLTLRAYYNGYQQAMKDIRQK